MKASLEYRLDCNGAYRVYVIEILGVTAVFFRAWELLCYWTA